MADKILSKYFDSVLTSSIIFSEGEPFCPLHSVLDCIQKATPSERVIIFSCCHKRVLQRTLQVGRLKKLKNHLNTDPLLNNCLHFLFCCCYFFFLPRNILASCFVVSQYSINNQISPCGVGSQRQN